MAGKRSVLRGLFSALITSALLYILSWYYSFPNATEMLKVFDFDEWLNGGLTWKAIFILSSGRGTAWYNQANQKFLANPQDMDVTFWTSHSSLWPPMAQSKAAWRSRCKVRTASATLHLFGLQFASFIFCSCWDEARMVWYDIYTKSTSTWNPVLVSSLKHKTNKHTLTGW